MCYTKTDFKEFQTIFSCSYCNYVRNQQVKLLCLEISNQPSKQLMSQRKKYKGNKKYIMNNNENTLHERRPQKLISLCT